MTELVSNKYSLAKVAKEYFIQYSSQSVFIRLMDSIETKSPQLADEYHDGLGALVILGDIAKVIGYRIAKGRALIQ